MAPNKQWMTITDTTSKEYIEGVDNFLNWAFSFPKVGNRIRCPCVACRNTVFADRVSVRFHLFKNGFCSGYTFWIHHGEKIEELGTYNYTDQDHDDGNVDDFSDLVYDACGGANIEMTQTDVMFENQQNVENQSPNEQAAKFYKLLEDAQQKLYPGCADHLTKLSYIIKLMHQKCLNKWTDKAMDPLLDHNREILPKGALVPDSYYDAKKIVKHLGLDYIKIDACLNDCILYREEYENVQQCPVCGLSRWKSNQNHDNNHAPTNKKCKKVPHKVLRYFPIAPRLQRLYMSRKTAKDMRWHKEENVDDGFLKHPADSMAWKNFDANHPSFASDCRNVRFGLASDGFNPFGNMSSSYRVWLVVLVPYNLPL